MLGAIVKKYWKLLLSTMLVSALGSASLIALSSAYTSLDVSLNDYMVDYRHPDAVITTVVRTRDVADELAAIPGVEDVDARLVGDTALISPEGRHLSVRAMSYDEDDFQKFHMWDEADPGDADPIYLEYNFAVDNGISVGDTVSAKIDDEYRDFFVAGIVSAPETLSVRPSENAWGYNSDFGYVYAPTWLLEKEPNPEYDEAVSELERGQDELAEAEQTAEDEHDQALSELDDAQAALADALEELTSSAEAIEEAQAQYDEGVAQLEQARAQTQNELASARATLESTAATLNSSEAQLGMTQADIDNARAQLSSAWSQYSTQRSRLVEVRNALNAGIGELNAIEGLLRNAISQARPLTEEEQAILNSDIQAAVAILNSVASNGSVDSRVRNAANNAANLLLSIDPAGDPQKALSTVVSLFSSVKDTASQVDAAIKELDAQASQLSSYEAKLSQAQSARNSIDSARSQLNAAWQTYYEKEAQANAQLASAQATLDEAAAKIADARAQLAEGRKSYEEGLEAYEESVSEVEAAWEDAQSEFEDVAQELRDAAAELSEWEGYQVFCNQFLLRMGDGADREQTLEAALNVLGSDVKSSYLYQDSPAKKRIDTNLAPIGTMSTFVPMVFFAVTLIVVFLFMSLIVRQSRREIGILRALGFSQRRIRALYCATNLVVSLGSILLGSLAGWGLCLYTNVRYAAFFPLPEFTDVFDWGRFALAATLTIAVGQLATILGTGIIGRIQPSEAMTRPAPADTNVPRVVEAATGSLTPLTKFSVASTLRNPLRFVFATVCLAASVMIIFASLSFLTSKDVILEQLFGQRINYDIQVFFDGDIDEGIIDELEALDYVDTVESMLYCASEVSFEGRTEKATINALADDAQLIRVYDESGNEAAIPESGIVLERHVAERIGADVGDTVEVDGVPMEVVEMTDQYVSRFQYVSLAQAEALGDEAMGSLVCSFDPAHEQDLVALISNKDGYVYSVLTSVFKEGLDSTFALTDLASWILIGFAVIIGLVIVINTTQTNLLEQKKELCVLRILGFQHRALSAHMFIQSLLSYVVACVIGLPCGILLAQISLARLTTADLEYPFANGPLQHLITALLVLVYVVVSHLIAMRTLKRWDLVESVKDRE